MQQDAIEKLQREDKAAKHDRCAGVMHEAVREALEEFCRQDEEFAQAIVQGKSFGECMKTVAAGCGSGLSDLEAYRRAVRFYFPGADIRMSMTVDLIGEAGKDQPQKKQDTSGIVLDFTQFL
ncbi:MAG: hypothetical protein IK095_05190 [Oscillospiraceae bacterium]|nr:hypothetical protein [Oscillospiraceae bacterium]